MHGDLLGVVHQMDGMAQIKNSFQISESTLVCTPFTGATLVDGEIKIRQNDAWGVNYGDDGNNGSLELNGANIPVTAGTYNITFDFNNLSIVMNAWAQ